MLYSTMMPVFVLLIFFPGDAYSRKCPDGHYLDVLSLRCKECMVCPLGYSGIPCNSTRDAQCHPCQKDSFKSTAGSGQCNKCLVCSVVSRPCTTTNNTICGRDENGNGNIGLLVGIPIGVFLLLFAIIVVIFLIWKRRRRGYDNPRPEELEVEDR